MTNLSDKQLAQRRAAGQSLAALVDRDYYRFIGRRGGRRFMLNTILQNAENLTCQACAAGYCKLVEINPAAHARAVEELRDYYRQSATEKYHDWTGNRLMLQMFEREKGE
jgi:hypothetical protein